MSFILIACAVGIFICGSMFVTIFNNLISLNKQTDRSWANVEVILKQRFDEIQQLVEVVEQYTNYEQQTLQKIIQARNNFIQATSVDKKIEASNEMSVAVKGLMALGEAYPDLKANTNFVQLQSRVSALEGQIADRRENFNEAVTNFNTRIGQIPDLFFANFLGYKEKILYHPPQAEMERPSLKLKVS